MEGDKPTEEAQKGFEKKKGKPKFSPGTYEVKVKYNQIHLVNETSFFTHDDGMFQPIHQFASQVMYRGENETSNDPMDVNEIKERVARLVSLAIAKKLAGSMFHNDDGMYAGDFRGVSKFNLFLPTCFVPIINGLGTIERPNGEIFTMVGQPAWTLTYLARAIANDMEQCNGVEQQIDHGRDMFVNRKGAGNPFRPLFELLKGVLNAWAQNAEPQQMTLGDFGIGSISVPQFHSNIEIWMRIVGQFQIPAHVVTATTRLQVIEPLLNNPVFTQNTIDRLQVVGVKCLEWSTSEINNRFNSFVDRIVIPIQRSMQAKFRCSQVTTFTARGADWQLLGRINDAALVGMEEYSNDVLDFGWMFGGRNVGIYRPSRSVMTTSDVPRAMRIDDYMKKGGN